MSIDTAFITQFREKIAEQIDTAMASVESGRGIGDFGDYRYLIGGIKAYRDMNVIIDDIIEQLKL